MDSVVRCYLNNQKLKRSNLANNKDKNSKKSNSNNELNAQAVSSRKSNKSDTTKNKISLKDIHKNIIDTITPADISWDSTASFAEFRNISLYSNNIKNYHKANKILDDAPIGSVDRLDIFDIDCCTGSITDPAKDKIAHLERLLTNYFIYNWILSEFPLQVSETISEIFDSLNDDGEEEESLADILERYFGIKLTPRDVVMHVTNLFLPNKTERFNSIRDFVQFLFTVNFRVFKQRKFEEAYLENPTTLNNFTEVLLSSREDLEKGAVESKKMSPELIIQRVLNNTLPYYKINVAFDISLQSLKVPAASSAIFQAANKAKLLNQINSELEFIKATVGDNSNLDKNSLSHRKMLNWDSIYDSIKKFILGLGARKHLAEHGISVTAYISIQDLLYPYTCYDSETQKSIVETMVKPALSNFFAAFIETPDIFIKDKALLKRAKEALKSVEELKTFFSEVFDPRIGLKYMMCRNHTMALTDSAENSEDDCYLVNGAKLGKVINHKAVGELVSISFNAIDDILGDLLSIEFNEKNNSKNTSLLEAGFSFQD